MSEGGDTKGTGKRPKPPGLVHTWAPPEAPPAPSTAASEPSPPEEDVREALMPSMPSRPPIIVDGPGSVSVDGVARPSRVAQTLIGMQPIAGSTVKTIPSAPRPSPKAETLFSSKGRVTLDLSGAILPLPGERPVESPMPALSLDLSRDELPISERDTEPEPKPDSQALELELDLSDEPKRAPHDAWTVDRKRRSTPAPISTPGEGIPAPWLPATARLPGRPMLGLDAPSSGALDLVERNRPSSPELDLAGEMAERYALGDFTGALKTAEFLLGRDANDAKARRYASSSRERLEQIYSSRLGKPERIPVVVVPDRSVRWLGLDHRAGFLLSRIDGAHSIDEIVDVSGMARLEALKTLVELLDLNAIRLDEPR